MVENYHSGCGVYSGLERLKPAGGGTRPETRTMSGSKSLKKEDRGWAKQMDASVVKQARHGLENGLCNKDHS